MNSVVALRTPSRKMDVDGFLKEKNDRLIEVELKEVQIENSRRQYLPSLVQTEKKTFPFYSQSTKKYEEQPFIKLEQKEDKLKIRFLNGFEKWINKANLKQVQQYEALTLQTYRKTIKNIHSNEVELLDLPKNKEIIEKINIDHAFLNKMLTQVYNKKNPRQQIKTILKDELFYNYQQSVKQFNKMFVERREIKKINRFQRKNKVSDDLKAFIDHHLVCSYGLQFLDEYMLNKTHYISTMVQSYNIIGKLERFQHFNKLYLINSTSKFLNDALISQQIIKYFRQQRDKIQNIIYSLQEHLNVLTNIIYKDIEHIIFLNPRLVGSNYQKDFKSFIASFSEHLSRVIRSVLINSINTQLEGMANFYKQYSLIKKKSFQCIEGPSNDFYLQFSGINTPIFNQSLNERMTHGPGVIPITFTLKKWKRKRYNNIYKFIIQSRKTIRIFNAQQWRNHKSEEERIIFKDPLQLLENIIIKPVSQYLSMIHESENVNGCIYNKKIELMDYINLQKFRKAMTQLYTSQRQEKVKMYATYFELWQLYFMEKPYIDDFIHLYKSIKAIKLIEEEMSFLHSDLQLIRSIPKIIELQFIRLDVTEIKQRIETTILAFMKKILKTCEETLGKMLEYGYQQTIKAKKLNEVTPFSNLAEYIDFINFLNQRQVQKSIQNIAQNVIFIDLNMGLLQKNRSEIKFNLMQRYLESGTWIKTIRAAAAQNKQKTVVDPFTFLKGIKDKRAKIFLKYNKILKEIIELMKVNELKNAMKLSILAKNIAHEMKEICVAADQIVRQQTLLELEYAPENPKEIDIERVYRTDLTFFYKQERFLKKYLHFWTYAAKLKSIVDNVYDRKILNLDGIQFIRLLREGQQLISNIKISTLNKRFLHLCDEVMHQIEPFLKCSKLFLFLTIGTQNYRIRVIKELMGQSSSQQMKIDPYNLTIKQLMSLPLFSLDWLSLYQIKQNQQNYEACRVKMSSIYLIIKNIQVNIKVLKGVGHMKQLQLIIIDEETMKIVKKCLQIIRFSEQKYGYLFKSGQFQEDILGQASKKINIFFKSISKLKTVSQKVLKYYPLFELVYSLTYSAFEDLNLSVYSAAYESLLIDMSKKADLAKKLTFGTFYDDKVRISYDEQLKRLQQFQIKFYTEMIDSFHNHTYYGRSYLDKQRILNALCSLSMENFNMEACKLMGQWCKEVKFSLQYDNDYYICIQEFQTIHKEKVFLSRRQKLFEVKKYIQNQTEKIEIKCGLLLIVEAINKEISNKIEIQTFQIFKLIYEYHYNIKNIFHFYINITNLFLQSIINAVIISFHLDLSLLYENKYDLNLLLATIEQNKTYNPKEKDNYFITQYLARIEDQFIAIINVLQERQYCLEDSEKGRIKKLYAYHSIPHLIIQNFNYEQNKIWLDDLKQQKQDDFINNMHLSPSFRKLHFLSLDSSKIEAKQIQKKQQITNFEEDLSINHMILMNESKHGLKSRVQKNKVKIIANIAPQLKLKDFIIPFKFQITNKSPVANYTFESFIATQLLMQALSNHKILVTNIHPNNQILGRNFTKVSKFISSFNKNMAVIVYSPKELLSCLKLIISQQRHKVNKFIYIYYDKMTHEEIQSQQIDEHCIVYEANGKLHLNNILKKQLNYNERQVFKTFVDTNSHFESCYPFIDGVQKIISPNLLKFTIDGKEKQLLTGLIFSYENHHGLSAEVTQQKLGIISQPVYAITDSHFLFNYYFDLAEFIYTKVLKIASNDINKEIVNDLVNNLIQPEQHTFAAYLLPIYDFTYEELFTTVQYQSFEQRIQDRYDKEVFHAKKVQKPYLRQGMLHELIAFLSGREQLPQKWNQFKLKGFDDANVKWFIIDISEDNLVCNKIFQFFMQSFSNNQYVFQDGSQYHTNFHFTQRNVKDHKHKLIFIVHPNQLNAYKKDFPPIPIINESMKFDPLKEFKIFIASFSSKFPSQFMSLIDIPSLLHSFRQILGCIDLQIVSIQSIEMMKNIFYIMVNEVRKREIALGHYSESSLTIEESKENLYGSIDLRQRTKLQQQMLVELQEIQKKMDLTRREIHKVYTQNLKCEQLLTHSVNQKLQNQFEILNPTSYNKDEINQILKSSLLFSFFYSLILPCPNRGLQLSKSLESLTGKHELYNYCFSIQLNKWERWEEIDTSLTVESCSPSTSSKVLHPKEIQRHNLAKMKLQALRDFSQDMDKLHGQLPPIIEMKGPQIFFMKMFLRYQFPFKLVIPQESYPRWLYEYQFSILKKPTLFSEPLRDFSESKNKKILRLFNLIKMKDVSIIETKIVDKQSLLKWKSAINFKFIKNGEQWHSIQNTSLLFLSSQNKDLDSSGKVKLLKSEIIVQNEGSEKNQYKLLTTIFGPNRFQMLQSQLQNTLISLKTYENRFEFLENYKFRQFLVKGLSNQQLQDIQGLKLAVTNHEKFSECRKKLKDIISKIKMQQNQANQELLPEELEKLRLFDRITEINQVMNKMVSSVEVKRSEISNRFMIRYMLKKPRKYERVESPETVITKKRLKSPVKVEFDDVLLFDENYDHSNILLEELSQIILFFNLNEKVLLVENKGSYDPSIIRKYVMSYKIYKKAIETMLTNKNTKPFTVDVNQLDFYEINFKEIELYDRKSLQIINQELSDPAKQKMRIIKIFNTHILDELLQIFCKNNIENIYAPKNHHYILFVPYGQLKYIHGLKTIIQDSQSNESYLTSLRAKKIHKLTAKIEEYVKIRAMEQIEKSNIGQNYIPAAFEKITDIKIYTSNIKNDLLGKKDMYDKINEDIATSTKNIVEYKASIEANEKSIKQMESSLGFWKLKRDYYIGNDQFKQVNKQIREFQRKRLEKELNRPEYIEDNSYNLSYIYTFNILADNNFFPDKCLNLLEQQYELNKSYQIFEEQKKLFQKHFNYGRLSAVIDNDQLVFGQGLITQDHLIMSSKVRGKFIYLKHVAEQIFEEKQYNKESLFSLNFILRQQLAYIHKHKGNDCEQIFNKYIAFFVMHKFIRYIIAKSIETTEQQLKRARESILKMKQMIEHEQLKLSSNKTHVQQIKSKYEITQRQLDTCKRNQDIFIQQTNQNLLLISALYFKHLLGFVVEHQFEFVNLIYNEQNRRKQGKKDKLKKPKQVEENVIVQCKSEGSIKQIQNKQILCSLAEYITDEMILQKRRSLKQKQRQFLITIFSRETIEEIINQNHVQNIEEFYQECIIYLVKMLFPNHCEVYREQEQFSEFDYRKFNIVSLKNIYKSNIHHFCKEMESNYKFDIKGLLNRISTKKQILNTTLLKFSEKIGLIQPKSSQSILRFLLQSETIQNIQEYLVNSFKAITNTTAENMYYDGEWMAKNQQKWIFYSKTIQLIQQKLKDLYGSQYNSHLQLYYIKLIAMFGKKIQLNHLDMIIRHIYYDHSCSKIVNQKQIKQNLIQKRYQNVNQPSINVYSVEQKIDQFSYISTLDSILNTPINFILVHGPSLLHKILWVKAIRSNKILKKKEEIEYYVEENKSKQYWILITINHDSQIQQLLGRIHKLKRQLNLTDENHMKFILFFESNSWRRSQLKHFQEDIQPIYRFFFKNSPISIYYHTNFIFQQFSQKSISSSLNTIVSIAKYYCSEKSHVPISHIGLSEIEVPQINQLLQNLFDRYDIPFQSIYFRLISSLHLDFERINTQITQKLSKFDKEGVIESTDLWEEQRLYNQIQRLQQPFDQKQYDQSLLSLWFTKIQNQISRENFLKKDKLKNISFSELMKPSRDEMGFLLNHIESSLSNPYKFIIINNCFGKLIDKVLTKRQNANNPLYNQAKQLSGSKQEKKQVHELVQITNKKELFLEILHGTNTYGLRLNNITVQISKKEVSGSIGVYFNIVGAAEEWLSLMFNGQIFMFITDKKHKNTNQLNFVKGVFFRYSEPIIYVKKQVQFGEEDTNVLRPLPQYKNLLPIYTSNNQYIGIIELTTNQQVTVTPTLVIKLKQ